MAHRGDATKADEYRTVFVEHPEFFRIDSQGHGSLVWRRQHQKLINVDTPAEMSRADYNRLTPEQKECVSRTPLEPPEVATQVSPMRKRWVTTANQNEPRRGGSSLLPVIEPASSGLKPPEISRRCG